MHLLIVLKSADPQATQAYQTLTAYLQSQHIDFSLIDASTLTRSWDGSEPARRSVSGIDLAVVLGGDGTILRTARLFEGQTTPILGINFGRLGFLANDGSDGVVPLVAAALAGDTLAKPRANLSIDVVCEGENDPVDGTVVTTLFDGKPLSLDELHANELDYKSDEKELDRASAQKPDCGQRHFFALNELAITRGTLGRMIDFNLSIAGSPLADMRGDGLVIASATGSTAYALSAGGPIVAPEFMGLIVVPIAAHNLHSRAIVTAENDIVEVNLTSLAADREATLFIDGDLLEFARPVRRVYVRRGETPTTFLRYKGQGFYEHASDVFFH